jgi:hypothetical protein
VSYALERDLGFAIVVGAIGGPLFVALDKFKDAVRARLVRKHGDGEGVREELERSDFNLERVLSLAALGVFMVGLGSVQRSAELVLFGLGGIAFAAVYVAFLERRLHRAANRD